VHCHDDLGMAVANSLDGGRRRRAADRMHHQRHRRARRQLLARGSRDGAEDARLRSSISTRHRHHPALPDFAHAANIVGVPIPRNKAIVGENAFAHESASTSTACSSITPRTRSCVRRTSGLSRSVARARQALGRHALRDRIKELGFELDDVEFARVFEEFKALADKKKELYDGDIEALVLQAEHAAAGPWSLVNLRTSFESAKTAEATVRLKHADGREIEMRSTGDGPVDAALKAIERGHGRGCRIAQVRGTQRIGGRRRPGRSARIRGVQSAHLSRLEREYQHRRVSNTGLPRSDQPHRARVRNASPRRTRGSRRPRSNIRSHLMPIPATKYIWFNGKLVPWEKATVHVLSHALHYGSSVFEGVRAYETPRGPRSSAADHTKRLFDSAKIYRINIPFTEDQINHAQREVIAQNGLARGAYLRPVAFRGYGEAAWCRRSIRRWKSRSPRGNGASISAPPKTKAWMSACRRGSACARTRFPRMAKAGGNYLSSQLIGLEAKRLGFVEGIGLSTDGT
jgi:hypothetical protein